MHGGRLTGHLDVARLGRSGEAGAGRAVEPGGAVRVVPVIGVEGVAGVEGVTGVAGVAVAGAAERPSALVTPVERALLVERPLLIEGTGLAGSAGPVERSRLAEDVRLVEGTGLPGRTLLTGLTGLTGGAGPAEDVRLVERSGSALGPALLGAAEEGRLPGVLRVAAGHPALAAAEDRGLVRTVERPLPVEPAWSAGVAPPAEGPVTGLVEGASARPRLIGGAVEEAAWTIHGRAPVGRTGERARRLERP